MPRLTAKPGRPSFLRDWQDTAEDQRMRVPLMNPNAPERSDEFKAVGIPWMPATDATDTATVVVFGGNSMGKTTHIP